MNKNFGKANNMDIYERLKNGEPINTREFKEILWPETVRSRTLCQKINSLHVMHLAVPIDFVGAG